MIRILAIDDHPLIPRALEALFAEHQDIQLVATGKHGSMLMNLAREHKPDVVILDLGMKTGAFDPISAVRNLKAQHPNMKVLVLTNYDDSLWVRELVNAGISGYMLKSDDFSLSIVQAIQAIDAGGKFFSPEIVEKLIAQHDESEIKLTPREKSILNLLAENKTTDKIAESLGVSDKRIRNMLVTIYDKLGIDKSDGIEMRMAAVNKARELGLLPDDESDENVPGG